MPNVVEVPLQDRLADLGRDRYSDEFVIVNLPKYRCPTCDQLTPFSIDESRFTDADRKIFDATSGDPEPWETVHCDFYCRICNSPVRVVCRMHEFAMSSDKYFPLRVFEIR